MPRMASLLSDAIAPEFLDPSLSSYLVAYVVGLQSKWIFEMIVDVVVAVHVELATSSESNVEERALSNQ